MIDVVSNWMGRWLEVIDILDFDDSPAMIPA